MKRIWSVYEARVKRVRKAYEARSTYETCMKLVVRMNRIWNASETRMKLYETHMKRFIIRVSDALHMRFIHDSYTLQL